VEVSATDLAALVPTLDRQQVNVLVRSVLGLKTDEQRSAVSLTDRLKAGLWEFMRAVGFVTDAQAEKLLSRMTPALRNFAMLLHGGERTIVFELTFVEQRWVAWPTGHSWYDLWYDEDVEQLPEPGVLKVVCDVTALFLRQEAVLAKLVGGKDAEPRHHAGDEAGREPGEPGQGTPA